MQSHSDQLGQSGGRWTYWPNFAPAVRAIDRTMAAMMTHEPWMKEQLGYSTPENSELSVAQTQVYLQVQEDAARRRQQHLQEQQEKLRQHLCRLQSSRPSSLPSLDNIAERLDAMESTSSVDAPLIAQAYGEDRPGMPERPRSRSAGAALSDGGSKRSRDEASTPSEREDPHRDQTRTHWSTGHWVGCMCPLM